MREKIGINFKESEKSFRNLIKNLRKKAADEAAESEMMIKLDQKKMRQNRSRLYTISYETQVQRWKINETAITTEKIK